jgi:hypothetical protein
LRFNRKVQQACDRSEWKRKKKIHLVLAVLGIVCFGAKGGGLELEISEVVLWVGLEPHCSWIINNAIPSPPPKDHRQEAPVRPDKTNLVASSHPNYSDPYTRAHTRTRPRQHTHAQTQTRTLSTGFDRRTVERVHGTDKVRTGVPKEADER